MIAVVIIIFLVSALIWYELYCGNKNNEAIKCLPGPKPLPWIGNGLEFLGSSLDYLNKMDAFCREYGHRVPLLFGSKVMILFTDPKDIEVMLSSHELLDKAKEYRFLHDWLGLGILTSTGERWRRNRKFLTPAFHFSILRHFVPIFDQRTDSFVKKLAAHAHGDPVDIYPLVTRCTLDQLSESAMGTSTEEQTETNLEYVNEVKKMTEIVNERIKNVFMRLDVLFRLSSYYATYTNALKTVKDYTGSMIRKRAKVLEEQGVDLAYYTKEDDDVIGGRKCVAFLDLLLLSEPEGKKMSFDEIQNEVDTILFEGHDTTASGLSFTLYQLASLPEIQDKLFQEQVQVSGADFTRQITFRDLNDMKYLELVLKESMRIYPPVPFVARDTGKDGFQLHDLKFPPNVSLAINIFTMHRDAALYPDPLKFIPERFLNEEVNKRSPYSYITFSAGPRNCIGQKFAMYEMKMTLAKLIRHFRFSVAGTPPLQLTGDITLKSANGIHVRIEKR